MIPDVDNNNTKRLPTVGDYALLQVMSVQPFGAFLDWGQPSQLLMPNREMIDTVQPGGQAVVHIFLDREDRPTASMRLANFVDPDTSSLKQGEEVDLLLFEESALGYTAIVNQRFSGILYHSEVFQTIDYGMQVRGFIKKIREDGKLDLILQPTGLKGSSDLGQIIIEKLREERGFLPITDKTDPEVIYEMFGVSKKKFKIALGGIYRRQLVRLDEDGIRFPLQPWRR